jgi:hypothetical protein
MRWYILVAILMNPCAMNAPKYSVQNAERKKANHIRIAKLEIN